MAGEDFTDMEWLMEVCGGLGLEKPDREGNMIYEKTDQCLGIVNRSLQFPFTLSGS